MDKREGAQTAGGVRRSREGATTQLCCPPWRQPVHQGTRQEGAETSGWEGSGPQG